MGSKRASKAGVSAQLADRHRSRNRMRVERTGVSSKPREWLDQSIRPFPSLSSISVRRVMSMVALPLL